MQPPTLELARDIVDVEAGSSGAWTCWWWPTVGDWREWREKIENGKKNKQLFWRVLFYFELWWLFSAAAAADDLYGDAANVTLCRVEPSALFDRLRMLSVGDWCFADVLTMVDADGLLLLARSNSLYLGWMAALVGRMTFCLKPNRLPFRPVVTWRVVVLSTPPKNGPRKWGEKRKFTEKCEKRFNCWRLNRFFVIYTMDLRRSPEWNGW